MKYPEKYFLSSFLLRNRNLNLKKINKKEIRKTKWTSEELEILKKLYPENSNKYISKILNKTKASIDCKAALLKLKKSSSYRKTINKKNNKTKIHSWKIEEIEFLKQNFKIKTYSQMAENLNRTPSSIYQKAKQLFLKKYNKDFLKDHL